MNRVSRMRSHPVGPPPSRNRKRHPYQGTVDFQGLSVRVENLAGSDRVGVDPDGVEWRTRMRVHYGEFVGTRGVDGDPVDCFVGPRKHAPFAYVVHARDRETGDYDECKVMLGFATKDEALGVYRGHYNGTGWVDGVRKLAIGELRAWLADPRNRGRKIRGGQELRKAIVLPVDLGALLWEMQEAELSKGRAHKYIRRVRRNGRWVYYYKVTGGRGLAHADELHVGAKFRMKMYWAGDPDNGEDGHWEVMGELPDGRIRVKHDETGVVKTATREEFAQALREHHQDAIEDVGRRAQEEHYAATVYGSRRQRERAAERVRERLRQFPELRRLALIAPPAAEPKWRPKGHLEHERLAMAFHLVDRYVDSPMRKHRERQLRGETLPPWEPDDRARRAARVALKALEFYGTDDGAVRRLAKRGEALGLSLSMATPRNLRAIAEADPSINPSGRYGDGTGGWELRTLFTFEHARGELAVDRKEPLKGNVALYIDTLRHEARSNYVAGYGTRGGMEALRDMLGQVRTKRGVKALEDLMVLTNNAKTGAARRIRQAREALEYSLGTARDRLKKADAEMERLGRSDLVSTAGRATPELDAAIAADIVFVRTASGTKTGVYQEFGHVLVSADRKLRTESWEARLPDHRFSQVRPEHSAVQRAFRERFGVSVHIEDAAFDTFNEGPQRNPRDYRTSDKAHENAKKRFRALEKAHWGISAMDDDTPSDWVSNAEKAAAAEVRMASEASTEMRADALRSVWTALEDMEKSIGPVDLSRLPIVISDRFVGAGAAAHYRGAHSDAELHIDELARSSIEPRAVLRYNAQAVRERPHIALGLKADKSLGHELAHYIENRLTVRPGGSMAMYDAIAGAAAAWARKRDPGFLSPDNQETWAAIKAGELEHTAGDIFEMLRTARHVSGLAREAGDENWTGGGKYMSNAIATILRWREKSTKLAYRGADGEALGGLANAMLGRLRKLPGGRELVELHEAIQGAGAYERFREKDKIANRGVQGVLNELHGRKDEASQRYWETGTEMTARAIEQYLYEAGAQRGEVNTTLTHPHYGGAGVGGDEPSGYFEPAEFNEKIAPKVRALLASMGEHMTKAFA